MSTEDKLKQLILSKYRSVREFTLDNNLPYSTVASLFTRGISNASITTVIKICQALCISADELSEGNIVFISEQTKPTKLEDLVFSFKNQILTGNLTINDKVMDKATAARLATYMDALLEAEKKNNP